jgi:hypothetical protein
MRRSSGAGLAQAGFKKKVFSEFKSCFFTEHLESY